VGASPKLAYRRIFHQFTNSKNLIAALGRARIVRSHECHHAIYERGVFRPLEAVDLPETAEVVFEPRLVLLPPPREARARVLAALAQRFDSGENDVSGRHDEHQP
jgi:predicted DNA-binding antitoxin AbrB/MazE fold protein